MGPRPENPLRPVETLRGSLRRGGTRKVGRMRVRMEVERNSPGPASDIDGGVHRVAQCLNFIVKPSTGMQATKSKRAVLTTGEKYFRGE